MEDLNDLDSEGMSLVAVVALINPLLMNSDLRSEAVFCFGKIGSVLGCAFLSGDGRGEFSPLNRLMLGLGKRFLQFCTANHRVPLIG